MALKNRKNKLEKVGDVYSEKAEAGIGKVGANIDKTLKKVGKVTKGKYSRY